MTTLKVVADETSKSAPRIGRNEHHANGRRRGEVTEFWSCRARTPEEVRAATTLILDDNHGLPKVLDEVLESKQVTLT